MGITCCGVPLTVSLEKIEILMMIKTSWESGVNLTYKKNVKKQRPGAIIALHRHHQCNLLPKLNQSDLCYDLAKGIYAWTKS